MRFSYNVLENHEKSNFLRSKFEGEKKIHCDYCCFSVERNLFFKRLLESVLETRKSGRN